MLQYGVPLYITENGIPSAEDPPRVSFLLSHLEQLWRAIQEGLPVKGYYHWSIVDNFEWAEGYNPLFRFGLFGVDRDTQQRIEKPSASVYARIVQENALDPRMLAGRS